MLLFLAVVRLVAELWGRERTRRATSLSKDWRMKQDL